MALTSGQIDELIREIAVRLGINENAPNVRQLVLDYDVEGVPTTQGLFTEVYGLVAGWIRRRMQTATTIRLKTSTNRHGRFSAPPGKLGSG